MSKDEYLITDAPLKALTVFAMPMILGSFFQQIYNMADSIIVGQFVGSSALAAVGACAALTNVFICVALGAGVGAGVLVSRYFGAREYGKMKTIVSTSLFSFLILSIVLGVFGFCFSHWMMSVLQTPGDILDAVLNDFRFPVFNDVDNRESGIRHAPDRANRQSCGNGFHAVLDCQAFRHHRRNDFGRERRQNTCFYAAAQTVGKHDNRRIFVLFDDVDVIAA